MMPINTTGINSLRNEEISHGTAIMNFGRNGWFTRHSFNGYINEFWCKNILSTSPSHLTATEIKQQPLL